VTDRILWSVETMFGPWHVTRIQAKAAGARYFYTGNPCKHGHTSLRNCGGHCTICKQDEGRQRNSDPVLRARKTKLERISRNIPENRAALRERQRLAIARKRASDPAFAEMERERSREYIKGRRVNDPEFRQACITRAANRAAKKRNAEGFYTPQDIERINARQNYKCVECGWSTKYERHVDHIMPLALGGSNWPSNLQVLCPICNLKKGAKHPIDFALQRGRLV